MQSLYQPDPEPEKTGAQPTASLDAPHLYPPGASLTHLGTLQSHAEARLAAEWHSRLDPGFSPLPRATPETGRGLLQLRPDQRVTILHAKVAQKSYGNEKRFFCPPPCVFLSGLGWRVKQEQLRAVEGAGQRLCGYMGLDSSCVAQTDTYKLAFEEQDTRMFACAKSLYISDTDKRKHFCLVLRLFLGSGQEVGSFHSRMIKVISKPSQKRQSMKNADLCISSGSRVALFNRLRSQTVSTRYLAVERGEFLASARQWTAFIITLDDPHADQTEFMMCEGFICYGCVVQLVCTDTGVALPPMVIRKVSKQHTILDVDEPVSQLHKCAFQFRDDQQMYLCLSNDRIIQYQAQPGAREQQGREVLNDGSCWTIIGTEVVEYSFSQGHALLHGPVSPVPSITGLEVNGGGHVAMLELQGENFSPHLRVWFGNIESETMFKSPRSLLCVVPDISTFSPEWRCLRRPVTVPLALRRPDGLVYRSAYSFTYTPEHSPPPPPRPGGAPQDGGGPDTDSLLDSIHQEFTRANFHLFMQT